MKGYKPHLVRELLGLTKEQFRYWRNKIDPNPKRDFFRGSDILVYRIMKMLVEDKHIPVIFLSTLDWTELFDYFNKTRNAELKNKYVLLDNESCSFIIITVDEVIKNIRNKVTIINLNEINENHINEFLEFGNEDVVINFIQRIKSTF